MVRVRLRPHRHILIGQHLQGIAPEAGVIDVRVCYERGDRAAPELDRADLDCPVGRYLQYRQPAVSRHVLVLLADALLQGLGLDVAGLLRQLLQRHVVPPIMMERVQQSHQIAARRADSGACGQVRHRGDFHLLVNSVQPQRLPGQLVLEFADMVHGFALAVMQADLVVHGGGIDHHVHVFIDPHGEDEPAVLPVVRGQVRPSAAQRDPKRCPGDDHASTTSPV